MTTILANLRVSYRKEYRPLNANRILCGHNLTHFTKGGTNGLLLFVALGTNSRYHQNEGNSRIYISSIYLGTVSYQVTAVHGQYHVLRLSLPPAPP